MTFYGVHKIGGTPFLGYTIGRCYSWKTGRAYLDTPLCANNGETLLPC